MIISDKAKKYVKEKSANYIVIDVKRNESFSGCGCSSKSVVTYSPKADIGYEINTENYIVTEVDGIKIALDKDIESTIKENTKVDVIGIFNKSLFIENYISKVVKNE